MRASSFSVVVAVAVALAAGGAAPSVAGRASTPASTTSRSFAKAESLVGEGKALFQRGDYAGAYARFRAAVAADPSHPTALFNAALAARKGGLLDDARGAYVELLAAHPDDLDVVWGLAEVERGLGHADAARALYAKILADEQRPDRQELVARARAAIEQLSSSSVVAPSSSPADGAKAEQLFQQGQALAKAGSYAEAARAFDDAVAADPTRLDAVLRGALQLRKAGDLPGARARYQRALSSTAATKEHVLDAQFGLGETERLAGNDAVAADLFRRYADGETRASEARYVARARELAASLAAPIAAPIAPPPPTTTSLPPPPVVDVPGASSTASAPAPAPVPAAPLPFGGDALVVADLLAGAEAARAAGDAAAADVLVARAHALAIDDTAIPGVATTPCNVDDELARGERALSARDPANAVLAFRRAAACDATRVAPLWGLSRAFDAARARGQGRRHAALYVAAAKRKPLPPDVDETTLAAAALRSEAPDEPSAGSPAGDGAPATAKPARAP